jgi:aspartate/methionine/tyrosine aminotransferase
VSVELRLSRAAAAFRNEGTVELMMRAQQLEREGRSIVHLEIGEPDFDTPAYITAAAKTALDEHFTHYAPVPGLAELREAVAFDAARFRSLPEPYAAENVVIGPGAKPLLWNLFAVLLDPGDEVVFADPAYPAYHAAASYLGAKALTFRLDGAHDWRPDLDELAASITPRTRAIVLNSPHNPTGGVMTADDLAAVAALALRHDILVVSDEIYSRNVYGAPFASIAQVPGMQERTIIIDGFSKAYAMTGWRLGYCIAPKAIVHALTLFANNTYQCVATFTQKAGIAALRGDDSAVIAMGERLRRRRDLIVGGLNALPGVHCALPGGAFYAFPNAAAIEPDDVALSRYLLEEAGVAALGGSSFGPAGAGHLRIAYATSSAELQRALDRLGPALAAYARANVATTKVHSDADTTI